MCVTLMVELDGKPEKLARRLLALERVALHFSLLSVADKPVKRHARSRAMLESMHDEAETPQAYQLSADERVACAEGLDAPFASAKRVKAVTAILLKLNAHELWENSESFVESVVSLEHVMPQTLDTTSWAEDWPDHAKSDKWLHMLGNFAVVNVKMNSKIKNGGFASKRDEFRKSPFPLTRKIADNVAWKEHDVIEAHNRLLALVKGVFDL